MANGACIGDIHVCPMFTGPAPHVGGLLVATGPRTVLLGGRPAATAGDLAICAAGPPAQIALGSTTVIIDGKLAARIGDITSHGGTIAGPGCPTVVIGG